MNEIKELIIHNSGVSRSIQKEQFIPINNYHKSIFGMKSSLEIWVGYNALIEPNGKLIVCRKDGEEGAHTIGHNKNSLGICLVGNFDIEMPTQPQINKLKSWLYEKMKLWGREVSDIYEHRDLQANRTCPGCLIPRGWGKMLMSPIAAQPEDAKKQMDLLNFIKPLPNRNPNKPVGIMGKVDKRA
jgi:hypothetical protein